MKVWILLLPEKTGIFTSIDELSSVVNNGKADYITQADSEKIARRLIKDYYSIERLFLMGIDNTGDMQKNKFYNIPQGCTFVERQPKQDLEEENYSDKE
ncbi:MAG: hypothetical protein LBQ71_15520 [Hungatella sp.]|nr:hypothetical protein [Hungatella sp.]